MQRGEVRHPIHVLMLSLLTCGIYAVWYGFFALPEDINRGLGLEQFDGKRELGLTVMTFGLWGFWYWWRLCQALVEVQRGWGVEPVLRQRLLFATLFGLSAPAAAQYSLNNAWLNGTPGGAGWGTYHEY